MTDEKRENYKHHIQELERQACICELKEEVCEAHYHASSLYDLLEIL